MPAGTNELGVELVTLSRGLFEEGSIGSEHFPELLEGRDRPTELLNFGIQYGGKTKQQLGGLGVRSTFDLLHLPTAELELLPVEYQRLVARGVEPNMRHMEQLLALTPSGRVIGKIFDIDQGPVPTSDEPALALAVDIATSSYMDPGQQLVFRRLFGLDDWQHATKRQIALDLHLGQRTVARVSEKAQAKMQYPGHKQALEPFRTLPLRSVGTLVGLVYIRDIPDLSIRKQELELSRRAVVELGIANFDTWHQPTYYKELLRRKPRSDEVRQEIATKLMAAMREHGYDAAAGAEETSG